MATETDKLAIKLESYVLQLREVETALEIDPTHIDLIKIKADLNELIDLTKKILTDKLNSGVVPITKTENSGGGSSGVPGPSRSSSSRGPWAANVKTEVPSISEEGLEPIPSDEYIKKLTVLTSSMQYELQQLGISINPEDGKCFAMLYEWRKRIGEMRMLTDLETILSLITMAILVSSKPTTDKEVMAILEEYQCMNEHNTYLANSILKILNEGATFFGKMVKCICNNCGLYGHAAKFCLRPHNGKAVNKLYREHFPEIKALEKKRSRMNYKRNKRLKRGLPT